MQDYAAADFTQPDTFFQIGINPVTIDILTSIRGVDFAPAWERRVASTSAARRPRCSPVRIGWPPSRRLGAPGQKGAQRSRSPNVRPG
jgi:hypothetical protein